MKPEIGSSLFVFAAKKLSTLGVQVDAPAPPLRTAVEVQTVMTLSHCPYLPGARLIQEEGVGDWMKSREVQTSTPDIMSIGVQSSVEDVSVQCADMAVDTSDMMEVAFIGTQTSIDSPGVHPEDESNVEVTFTFDIPGNTASTVTKKPCVEKSVTDNVSQTEVEDTARQLLPHERLITRTSSKDSSDILKVIRTRPELRSALQRQQFAGAALRRRSTGTVPDGEEASSSCSAGTIIVKSGSVTSDGRPPQPPHSPLVRSKYVRKLRNSSAQSTSTDNRIFNATPPRRFMRNRKASADRPNKLSKDKSIDKSSEGETGSRDDMESVPMRERTRSDSSMLHPRVMACTSDEIQAEDTRLLCVSTPSSPAASGGTRSFDYYSPLAVDSNFRKSPSPSLRKCTVSPVRRLKTAAELIKDSEKKRRSQSVTREDRHFPTCDKHKHIIPRTTSNSSSSDKENDKGKSRGRQTLRHSSRENTPVRSLSIDIDPWKRTRTDSDPGHKVLLAHETSLSQPCVSEQCKPPLADLTNETKVKEDLATSARSMPEALLLAKDDGNKVQASGGKTEGKLPLSVVRKEDSKPDSITTLRGDCCGVVHAVGCSPIVKGRHDNITDTPHSPKSLKSRASSSLITSREHISQKLFGGRKGSGRGQAVQAQSGGQQPVVGKSGSSQPAGAVTALCRQAMQVQVDDKKATAQNPETSSQDDQDNKEGAASAEGRTRKGKFLDANWLQKPKKFFKVSK